MAETEKRLVQDIEEMSKHYYQAPYPLLSFLFGLYCDSDWSTEAFTKWQLSDKDVKDNYQWVGYLDPYPNIPQDARQIISVKVPSLPEPPGGRRTPTVALAQEIWPQLLNELTFPSADARLYHGRPSGRARARFEPTRAFVSSLSLIYLENSQPTASDVTSALQAGKYADVGQAETVLADLEVIYTNRVRPGTSSKDALLRLKAGVFVDFTSPNPPW